MTIYAPRRIDDKTIELNVFDEDYRYDHRKYTIKEIRKNVFSCNCPGFYRQKDKIAHSHILLVKHWINNLEEENMFLFNEAEGINQISNVFLNSKLDKILNNVD